LIEQIQHVRAELQAATAELDVVRDEQVGLREDRRPPLLPRPRYRIGSCPAMIGTCRVMGVPLIRYPLSPTEVPNVKT
jgi:hypothetical protein